VLQKKKQALIASGKIDPGTPIVPISYEVTKVDDNGKLVSVLHIKIVVLQMG
jgi:hypothetical protein